MEKKSIFRQIDALYTKAVKVIIAEGPEENNTPISVNKQTTSIPATKIETLTKTISNVKDTLLNIGTPDEKETLYKEVVKREKQETQEDSKSIKEKTQALNVQSKKTATKTNTSIKKNTTVKKTVKAVPVEKSIHTDTAKPVSKKATVSKTKTETTKKVAPQKTPEKKGTTRKKVPAKATTRGETAQTITKSKAAPKGAKKAAKIALYIKDIKKHYGEVDEAFVAIIVNNLGPSIYKKNAELVTCSDPKELNTVRKSFLIKKLGIDASKGVLDAAIQDVCEELKSTRTKYRATFYYALAKKFKKESVLK